MGILGFNWLFGRGATIPDQITESDPLLAGSDSARHDATVRVVSNEAAAPDDNITGEMNRDPPSHIEATAAAHASIRDDQGSGNALMLGATMYSFAVLGMFVSTTGVILSSVKADYGLRDAQVSLLFLAAPAGYLVAAQLNRHIHLRHGRRGIAVIGPLLHITMAAVVALHPPFPVVLLAWIVGSLGHGVVDGPVCAWAGDLENASAASGLLHGAYSAGAGLGPFLAGTLISREGQGRWFEWSYVLGGVSIVELVIMTFSFRSDDATSYGKHINDVVTPLLSSEPNRKTPMRYRSIIWICASFLLVYVGTESLITGWIVAYMERIRHMPLYAASLCSTAFGLGMAIGRLVLGLVTEKFGVRRAVPIYVVCATIFDVLFAVSPMWTASSSETPAVVLISLVGFCLGPLFPSAIVLLVQLLPRHLHVRAVSVVALVGQVGAALLPFGLGVMAEVVGIQLLPLVVFICLATMLILWGWFARPSIRNVT